MTDENFKISLPNLQVLTPIFHSNPVSALQAMLRMTSIYCFNYAGASHTAKSQLQNWSSHFARISVSLTVSEKLNVVVNLLK